MPALEDGRLVTSKVLRVALLFSACLVDSFLPSSQLLLSANFGLECLPLMRPGIAAGVIIGRSLLNNH